MYTHWAKAGGFLFIVIIFYVLLFTPYKTFNLQTVGWLNLAFLMLHQFEEYVYPGGFKEFFNSNISGFVRFKLNDRSAFHVNVTLGWSFYFLAAILSGIYPILLVVALGINLLNGLVHTGAAIVLKKYNPGFLSGLFIFIPFSVYVLRQLAIKDLIISGNWFMIAIFIIAGALTIPMTLYIFKEKK